MGFAANQYPYIKKSREVVLSFCEGLRSEDFIKSVPDFGRGSIRDTYVHIANVYEFWIGNFSLKLSRETTKTAAITTVQDLMALFKEVDLIVDQYLDTYKLNMDEAVSGEVPWLHCRMKYSAIEILTHVITHEFHHKGQIMMMGKVLGYTPPDADVIRL